MHKLLSSLAIATMSFSSQALADDGSVYDQYRSARSFLYGGVDPDDYERKYREVIFADINGKWANVGANAKDSGMFQKTCETYGVTIEATSKYQLKFTTIPYRKSKSLEFIYTYRYGGSFSEYTDVIKMIESIDGKDAIEKDRVSVDATVSYNRLVTLVRPSRDILVLRNETGRSDIYARCP